MWVCDWSAEGEHAAAAAAIPPSAISGAASHGARGLAANAACGLPPVTASGAAASSRDGGTAPATG